MKTPHLYSIAGWVLMDLAIGSTFACPPNCSYPTVGFLPHSVTPWDPTIQKWVVGRDDTVTLSAWPYCNDYESWITYLSWTFFPAGDSVSWDCEYPYNWGAATWHIIGDKEVKLTIRDNDSYICNQYGCCSNHVADHTEPFRIIQVDHLQYLDPNAVYQDVPGVLYVPVNATVTFKAIPEPEVSVWAYQRPEWSWSYGASCEGDGYGDSEGIQGFTFWQPSSYSTDYKMVSATCGTSETANVIVVRVNEVDIYQDGTGWLDVSGSTITVLKGTKYRFRAKPAPLNAQWPPNCPVWTVNGAPFGFPGETEVEVTFDSVGSKALTAKCGAADEGKTVTINVVEPMVYQFGAGGTHALYETPDQWDGWARGSTGITNPVYVDDPVDPQYDENDAICVTRNSSAISLTDVRLKVPTGLTYSTTVRIDAAGDEDWDESGNISFSGLVSDPATLPITGSIVNYVDNIPAFEIEWKYKVPSPNGTDSWYTMETTSHRVYVTYDTPSPGGDELTEQRISTLCGWAALESTPKDVADRIHSFLDQPFGHDENQTDDWDLMWRDPQHPDWTLTGMQGECDEHARFMVKCLHLIGVTESVAYNTYASEDTEVYEDQDSKTVNNELYYVKFDANGDGEVDNNFEGSVCIETPHYYTVVGPKTDAATDCLLWRKLGPDGEDWKQKWIRTPNGTWEWAWPPQPTLPGDQGYVSCP